MDYSKFTNDNFDAKEWVNSAFKSQKDGSKDQYATTLVMKLCMVIQEVNKVVEENCQQLNNNIPWVVRDLENLKQESQLLQEQMKIVRYDIEKVEHDTATSMKMLLKLDTIKTRMKDASDALQEADNWATLSADVDDVFDSGDFTAISQKLQRMQQSLNVLSNVPDYEERRIFLETLKNRLEAMMSPGIVTAFNSSTTEAAQNFVKIFKEINRIQELTQYYHKCKKNHLLKSWQNILEEHVDQSFQISLNNFYGSLLDNWYSQINYCAEFFDEPIAVVCNLIADVMKNLDPSFSSCISAYLKDDDSPFEKIIELKHTTDRFASNLGTAIETTYNDSNAPTNKDVLELLSSTIYSYCHPYIGEYNSYENAILTRALDAIRMDHSQAIDSVELLHESVNKLFEAAKEANERCISFTNGCGYVKLIAAYKSYFSDYVNEFKRVVTNLREKFKQTLHIYSEDWSTFHHTLRIIQTCGALLIHLEDFDCLMIKSIKSNVGYVIQDFRHIKECSLMNSATTKEINPFNDYRNLLLSDGEDKKALENLVLSIKEDESILVLDSVMTQFCNLSEIAHSFSFAIVFNPIKLQLVDVPTMQIWKSKSVSGELTHDLPAFSLSPQEYITKIGQYLLTLPQQLEPFTMQDNPSLTIAVKNGKLPFINKIETGELFADLWLESISRATMHSYVENILKIPELSNKACRQLVVDIDYLTNVLEDIGLSSSDAVTNIVILLKTDEEDFSEVSKNMPPHITSSIMQMRKFNQ